ncbi:MAG: MalY/PatB family protein [Dermatophilaceae bacterium]
MPVTLTPAQLRARHTMKWTRHGPEILPLWVAEMDFATCPAVGEAVREAAAREVFGYETRDGRLARATAAWCERRYGWSVDPARIREIPDVLRGVELVINHFTTPGSDIVLPVPAYMPFFDVLHLTGRRGVYVPMLRDGAAYHFDLEAIEDAFRRGAGGIIVCNPYNPIGAVFSAQELHAVCALAERYGARVVSDEIHATLVYDGRHVPTASVSDVAAEVTITLLASSKGFNTPGLKCAQLVFSHDRDLRVLAQVNRMVMHGASTLGIEASIAAYERGEPWLDELLAYLRGNRDYLVGALSAAVPGIGYVPPAATYLAWLDFTGVDALKGEDPSAWLLHHAKVSVNPGPAFGPGGEHHTRLNFGTSRAILSECVERMSEAIACA